ncbi:MULTISPECIES: site-2 protease family protein [Francisella]|uniref:Site-2 protease family protein n=1 Tax=Francisella opportunistica TaxID=2016517 RepID=A0A345JSI4_9GAMM|nr:MULTISPECIES: site-2 protease family protein [Francisella]APC92050.1 membrane metalloprotease [Francisella sp. MA067296]AXH30280.1 site-2 protease family protein [Francisella opportunistica]AXH31921.1 site-2 protease family protein [Francisella opportunistica]AXH33567.1 site-2 protease family protein [Francisella opportunistica]
MDINHILMTVLMAVIPLIFAITMHEAAHGFIAKICGDNTAYKLGRVTLNPVPHIDPLGSILFPGLMLISSISFGFPFIFGWAKPVPIDYSKLKNPKLDMSLIAIAGPLANLIMVFIWAIVAKYVTLHPYIQGMAFYGIMINVVLMVLNLLPIPPLDGSRIISSLLPVKLAYKYNSIERYGFFIILALIVIPFNGSNLLFFIMKPFITAVISLIQFIIF